MFETIVITTAELVGAASGATWNADWSFALSNNQLKGTVSVSSQSEAEVYFTLESQGPWLHKQDSSGGFEFVLVMPEGGGVVGHIPNEPVWALNGSNWLVPPMNMGGSGAGLLKFTWDAPSQKAVPSGTLLIDANWKQSANMTVRVASYLKANTWDLNGDGVVGPADLLIMLQSWGNPWGASDLFALLKVWMK